jgi:hypothetical protein
LRIIGARRWRKQCEERAQWKKITEEAKYPQWVVTPVKEEEEEYLCYIPQMTMYDKEQWQWLHVLCTIIFQLQVLKNNGILI